MKKHLLLGATLLSLFAASCSNDDIIDNGNEVVTGKTITLNATISNGADTKLTYTDDGSSNMTVAWSNSESFTLYKGTNGTGSTFTKTAESGSTFKGNDIDGEGTYYAVYGDGIKNTNGTLSIDLSGEQVGTNEENGIKEFMLATASALSSSTTLTFNHKLTVLKMTLTLPSDVTGKVSQVTISGLHNKATYDLSKTTGAYAYADDGKGVITATNGETGFAINAETHKITAYVAVFPESVSANQVKLIANVGFNDYAYTITNAKTLIAGKVVPVSASLALVEKNFKSAYTATDYKTWSEDNCGSAVSYDDMCKYLGAGVYLDTGTDNTDGNQQTYTVDGIQYHTGLWLKKKAYIGSDVTGTQSATTTLGRPADINKYFFLPAAGGYNYGVFYDTGSAGYYWSSSPNGGSNAYYLYFFYRNVYMYKSVYVYDDNRDNNYYLPMVAE